VEEVENTKIGYQWVADPTDPNTDDVGIDDGEELGKEPHSRPKAEDMLFVKLSIPAAVDDKDTAEPALIEDLGGIGQPLAYRLPAEGSVKDFYVLRETDEFLNNKKSP